MLQQKLIQIPANTTALIPNGDGIHHDDDWTQFESSTESMVFPSTAPDTPMH